jgi:hypothetical protein
MSFLFHLIDVLTSEVISDWCDLHNFVHLDTSICNEKERIRFLELISSPIFAGNFKCEKTKIS